MKKGSISTWNPERYQRFASERRQPWVDLVAGVEAQPDMTIADLGCGDGGLTVELHRRFHASATLGIDDSPEMLERATADGNVRFERGDLASWEGDGTIDLVFSNAALHWVGDHPSVLARWSSSLSPRGQLAVQVPANHDHPSHRIADEVAREEPFASWLGGYQHGEPVLDPRAYDELFYRLGFPHHQVQLRVYGHVLGGVGDVVEWVKGSLMLAYGALLDAEQQGLFLARYRQRLTEELGVPGPYYYTYKRILMWASRRP